VNYAIKVNAAETSWDPSATAHESIRALLQEGHSIVRIFFYHDGVHQAFGSEFTIWEGLAKEGGFDMVLCSQALETRGRPLIDNPPFIIGGLALWVDACLKAERVLTLGRPSYGV
jgi:tRNA 2-thiouridine synthesizing protein D